MKKVFLISSVLLFLVLLFLVVYNFAFRENRSTALVDPDKKTAPKEDEALLDLPSGALAPVIHDTVLGVTLADKTLLYYSRKEKALKQADLSGKKSEVLFASFPSEPSRVVWSPRKDATLLLLDTPSGPLWHLFTLKDKKLTPLKKEMSRLAWTNLGDSIFYQFAEAGGRSSLNVSSPDGSNWRKLTDLASGSFFIAPVPQSSSVSFWSRPNGLEQNSLQTVPFTGGEQKTLFKDHYGTDFLWSPKGDRLLVGSVTEKGKFEPSIGLANENGGEYRDLLVPTLISKVVWGKDNQSIYYAHPGTFSQETVLPNDYFGKPIITRDTFWKMDVVTGKRERLIPLEEIKVAVDATELFLTNDENTLFFTDRVSGKLYGISL